MINPFPFRKKNKVCLVLGGGVARGLAHIGVLKVFQSVGLQVDMVVGTSIGSLIGAAFCAQIDMSLLEKKAQKMTLKNLLDFGIPRFGLIEGRKLEKLIKEILEERRFQDLEIPLAVVTTDINAGVEIIHRQGMLWPVVKASCSVPGIFNPVKLDKKLLVDGAVLHNIPTKIARDLGADIIIAVDVGFCIREGKKSNLLAIFMQAWHLRGRELSRYQDLDAKVLIEVSLPGISPIDFHRGKECIQKGEEAARKKLPQIRKILKTK